MSASESSASGILVVGGAVVSSDHEGYPTTKAPIANYINELAHLAGRCVWVAPQTRPLTYTTRLDRTRVDIIPLRRGPRGIWDTWREILRRSNDFDRAIMYLPAMLPLIPVATVLKYRLRVIAVYLAGDYTDKAHVSSHRAPMLHHNVLKLGFTYCLRSADLVIARGKYLSALAGDYNGNVFETVPIGHVLPKVDSTGKKEDGSVQVLFVGKVDRSKGIEDLIHVAKVLVERLKPSHVRLNVVGDGRDLEQMQHLTARLGLGGHIHFCGWADSSDELGRQFAASDVLVVPSAQSEGVPRVIDEAMQYGVPVVATRVGGIPMEFQRGEVVMVDPCSREQLADAIESVVTNGAMRAALQRASRERVAAFAKWSSAADQHYSLLETDRAGRHPRVAAL